MPKKQKLVTLCILCKDEDRMLDACLNYHERFFENIVVLDGNSSDETMNVLKKHRVTFKQRAFSGSFAEERNYLSSMSPTDWVLHVDCDELFNWTFLDNLEFIIKKGAMAHKIKRLNLEPLDPNPETYEIRLYDRAKAEWKGDLHEVLVRIGTGQPIDSVSGATMTIDAEPIVHVLKHEKARIEQWERWASISQDTKKVLVCILVKDQAKWLPQFLESLENIEYSRRLISYAFLEGDSTDGSLEMLKEWAKDRPNATIGRMNLSKTSLTRIQKLTVLRNEMINRFLDKGFDCFLWVDSDIMLAPGTLRKLLKVPAQIVAPMILIEGTRTFYDTLAFRRDGKMFSSSYPYYWNFSYGSQQVDSVGACYLADSKVYKEGARYEDGESEQVTFCKSARDRGFTVWLDATQKVYHIDLSKYGEQWH